MRFWDFWFGDLTELGSPLAFVCSTSSAILRCLRNHLVLFGLKLVGSKLNEVKILLVVIGSVFDGVNTKFLLIRQLIYLQRIFC